MPIPTPNMGLPMPVVGVDEGPTWAQLIDACFTIIDGHTHQLGSGVQITPDGLNINSVLSINGNPLTAIGYAQLSPLLSQPTVIGGATGSLYEFTANGLVPGDLWFLDGGGNQIQLTSNGLPVATGGFTGLPGTGASASASAFFTSGNPGFFTFQWSSSALAPTRVGPLTIGTSTALSKTVTITPSASQAANYSITLPVALPVSTSFLTLNSAGNMAEVASTGTGSVVLSNAPTFSGNPAGTISSDAYVPTLAIILGIGSSPSVNGAFFFQRIGRYVSVWGSINVTTGGAGVALVSATLPFPPSVNFTSTVSAAGALSAPNASGGNVYATVGAKTVTINLAGSPTTSFLGVAFSFSYDAA